MRLLPVLAVAPTGNFSRRLVRSLCYVNTIVEITWQLGPLEDAKEKTNSSRWGPCKVPRVKVKTFKSGESTAGSTSSGRSYRWCGPLVLGTPEDEDLASTLRVGALGSEDDSSGCPDGTYSS